MTLPASAAVNVSGARGALVGLAMLIESDSQFSMEGDVMIWVDGCGRASARAYVRACAGGSDC